MSYSTTNPGQEASLYIQAQSGDRQSLEELMRMHEGLVHHMVRQQWRAVHCAEKEQRAPLVPVRLRSGADPRAALQAGEVQAALYALVGRLPALQRWIVCTYYGLDGRGGCPLAELGRQRGCSRQANDYHLHKALTALRHPALSAQLRALLDRNTRADYRDALRAQGRQR